MAWLQKRGRIWWIGYYVGGAMVRKSLGTDNEAIAKQECDKVNALKSAKASGAALEPLFESLTGKSLPKVTIKQELESWLREVKRTTSANTCLRYTAAATELTGGLKATDKGPLLMDVTTQHLREHLDRRYDETSAATANLERKILRIFFKRAKDNELLKANPILAVKHYRAGAKKRRRAFDAKELSILYKAAPDAFWRYMILGGFYSGLRLGDLVTLEIEDVDFGKAMISRRMGKVDGKVVHIPIAPVLATAILKQVGKRSSGHVWPQQAALYRRHQAKYFSNQFYELLAAVKLVPERTHRKRKKGRNSPHVVSEVSFHSLRHTFVTFLKSTGASAAVAKELAGHSSDAINQLYTHMPAEALTKAVAQLPQFVE